MITDQRPRGKQASSEYTASGGKRKLRAPSISELTGLASALASATAEESLDAVQSACTECVRVFSHFYKIGAPIVQVRPERRPHKTHEGKLAAELFGDYDLGTGVMRLWLRTPMTDRWTSPNTLLSTLCHEFMHHLDVKSLNFPHTYHTIGFYERTHRLYLATVGSPYYSLAWDLVSADGSRRLASVVAAINWPETNRAKTRAFARRKALE